MWGTRSAELGGVATTSSLGPLRGICFRLFIKDRGGMCLPVTGSRPAVPASVDTPAARVPLLEHPTSLPEPPSHSKVRNATVEGLRWRQTSATEGQCVV